MKNRISGIVIGILLLIVAYQGGYLDSLFSKKSLACNSKEAIDLGKTIIEEKIFPRDFGKVEFVIEDIEFKSIFTKDINKDTGLHECTATTNILAHFDLNHMKDLSIENFFNILLGSDSVVYVTDDLYIITSPVSYTTQYTNDNKEYSVALKFDGDRTKGLYSKNMEISNEEAFRKVLEFAKKGNSILENRIGVMYQDGIGTNVDFKEAKRWYEKAAKQNYSWGFHNLGQIYYYGNEVIKDYKKAFEFFKKSAELNNDSAQNYLGRMYYHGNYVNKDYKQSIYWYEKSNNHEPEDLFNLGHMYNKGFGTIQNNNKAFELFKQASEKGHIVAKQAMVSMYINGNGVEQDFIAAMKLLEELAGNGDLTSIHALAIMYHKGTEKDKIKAKALFDDACKKGYTKSCNKYKDLESNNKLKNDN